MILLHSDDASSSDDDVEEELPWNMVRSRLTSVNVAADVAHRRFSSLGYEFDVSKGAAGAAADAVVSLRSEVARSKILRINSRLECVFFCGCCNIRIGVFRHV